MNSIQSRSVPRITSILAVTALALGLSACGKTEDTTVGQRVDSSVERSEQAAADARARADNTIDNAGDRAGRSNMGESVENAANRTAGAVDDATITAQVNASLAKDPDLSALKINVDTVNGKVTLNGPAPSTVARDRAESIAKSVEGVTEVSNQLVVMSS